jgi:uncharacterized DUF497 family protein
MIGGSMGRGKPFQCEITVSSGVKEKLVSKHDLEIWEIEEVIYDDPYAFSLKHKDCFFIYGQTSSGRYLLVLVRILTEEETLVLGYSSDLKVLKIISAREMNKTQRKIYLERKGAYS